MPDENTTDSTTGNVSPPATAGAGGHKEQRKEPRYRVKWHADVLYDDQSEDQGFVNDISTLGASILLSSSSYTEQATLHIHIPPLSLTAKPHIIVVSAKTVYVVYDSDRQLFRAAFNFQKFNLESDLAYLVERLTKYQAKIHDLDAPHEPSSYAAEF